MQKQLITLDHFVAEILDQWPETIRLFLEYRMACVGCSLSSFDTLGDALRAYNLPQEKILEALNGRANTAVAKNGNGL